MTVTSSSDKGVNTLRSSQNGRHFSDDILKCIFLNENVRISIKIWMKFVLKGSGIGSDNGLAPTGDKPLSETMMARLSTYMCHSASMS